MAKVSLILFDIDGTLLSAGGAGKESCNQAFNTVFNVKDAWGTTAASGKTDHLIFQEIALCVLGRELSTTELSQISKLYLTNLEQEIAQARRFRVLPGVTKLCSVLAGDSSVLVGLETGNLERAAYLKLSRGALHSYFTFGGFGSDHHDREKIVEVAVQRGTQLARQRGDEVESIYVIGDAVQDIQAGKAIGATTVAVATGSLSTAELAVHHPDYILETLCFENFDLANFSGAVAFFDLLQR